MTSLETAILEKLGEGLARWKIAEDLEVGESTVRKVIRRLCQENDCSQRELPDKLLRKENESERVSN